MTLVFDWNVVGGAAFVAVALVTLGVAIWRLSPVGATTVQLLQDQLHAEQETRRSSENIAQDLAVQIDRERQSTHEAELTTKDLVAEIAALQERPNTEQMLRVFETHHQENQAMMSRSLENQEALLELATKTLEGVGAIITQAGSDHSDHKED